MSLLIFDSLLLKENIIAYCSYYISKNNNNTLFETKYFCCLIRGSYLLEVFSIFLFSHFIK